MASGSPRRSRRITRLDGVFCNNCEAKLDEAPTLLPDQRPPCPQCSSLARRITRTITSNILRMPGVPPATVERVIGVDAVAPTAEGTGQAFDATVQTINAHSIPSAAQVGGATVVPGPRIIRDHLVVQGCHVWWTQLTEEGGWLLQVVDEAGEEIATAAHYDPVEALAAVAEFILPSHPG
jgi:hypothetical protein